MSKITESARGEQCQVRIPGDCNHNPETTVFAHLGGAGLAIKAPDFLGAYACSTCHDIVDGRAQPELDYTLKEIDLMFYEGIQKTQMILHKKGLLRID